MGSHIVKVLKADFVTHNVKRFVVEKPGGYSFAPGQATEVAILKPGLENERRPFTFTNLPDSDHLEFMIKIYTGHQGMTENLLDVNVGDKFIVDDVFGTIQYKDTGLYIAAGAGITPFISIFRQLKKLNKLQGNTLLFANRTEDDIILKDELKQMLGENYFDIIEMPSSGTGKRIDKELINQHGLPERQFYYVCGPEKFTAMVLESLTSLGIEKSQIIFEQ